MTQRPAGPGSALAGHRPGNSGVKWREQRRQVQPAPFALSEIRQLAGAPAVALVTRLGDIPAAATPSRGFRAPDRARPGGAALAVLALSSARLPISTRQAQPSPAFRVRRPERRPWVLGSLCRSRVLKVHARLRFRFGDG